VRAGDFWALVGRNGGGKTTLLRSLLGLLPPIAGEVRRRPRLRVGYVSQRAVVDGSVPARVIDLVRGGLDVGWSFLQPLRPLRLRAAVERALRDADVVGLAERPFVELSEGQKQRALLARALASDPELLVLDEPTSAMDLAAERATFALLEELRRTRQVARAVVGHHLPILLGHATHVALLDRDASVALAGPAQELLRSPAFEERHPGLVVEQVRGGA
jgi:zinc transport system ATP-binding protein